MRAFWLIPLGGTLGVMLIGSLLSAAAGFRFTHPQARDLKFVVRRDGSVVLQPDQLISGPSTGADGIRGSEHSARAVVNDPQHDFGTMNPLSMGQHAFEIRNEGSAPLQLRKGATTCKCTLPHISRGAVPPGESASVLLQWNSGRDLVFSHSATIYTNDPESQVIQLHITGEVRIVCAAEPRELLFGELDPVQPHSEKTIVFYSRVLADLDVRNISCSLDGWTWRIEPLDEQAIADLRATSGLRVRVVPPRDIPAGEFHGHLHLQVANPESATPENVIVPLAGSVAGRMSLMGAGVDAIRGVVTLGVVERGKACERRLVLRLRDAELPNEKDLQAIVQPAFLQARVQPLENEGARRGLYYIMLRVPPNAPPCTYLGNERGQLILKVAHPRLKQLTIGIEFAVLQPS